MNNFQRDALVNHCRLASECLLAPARIRDGVVSIILSVNSGYE